MSAPDVEYDDDELVLTGAAVEITGGHTHVGPPPPCQHRTLMIETLVGIVEDDGEIGRREVAVRAMCSCGVPMRFVHGSARPDRVWNGTGVVVIVEPDEA